MAHDSPRTHAEPIIGPDRSPRPNVASGTAAGYLTLILALPVSSWVDTYPSTLEGWLVALQPLVGGAIAYVRPTWSKAWAALLGAGLIPAIILLYNIVTGQAPIDPFVIVGVISALVQAATTAVVANTKT